eukprot:2946135-Karenia_brevis.AAC.1
MRPSASVAYSSCSQRAMNNEEACEANANNSGVNANEERALVSARARSASQDDRKQRKCRSRRDTTS